jgi:hypothetical protein
MKALVYMVIGHSFPANKRVKTGKISFPTFAFKGMRKP